MRRKAKRDLTIEQKLARGPIDLPFLALVLLLTAVGLVVLLLSKQIPLAAPGAPFLNFDMKDTILIIGGLMYGPTAGILISAVVCFIEMITISSTGLYGFIMNLLATCMMVVPAGMCYQRSHTLKGAVLGLVIGVVLMTASMLLWNYAITPYYMGVAVADVRAMIPALLLPFNLIKAVLNVGLVLLLYKHIGLALRKAGFLPRKAISASEMGVDEGEGALAPQRTVFWRTAAVSAMAVLLIAVSMVVIFAVLDGSFGFGA